MNLRSESSDDNERTAERDQPEKTDERSRAIRVRDLPPEKDPMGAANESRRA